MSATVLEAVRLNPKIGKPKDDAAVEIDVAFADAVAAACEFNARKAGDAGVVFVIGYVGALAYAADRLNLGIARFEAGAPRLCQTARRELHGFRVALFLLSPTAELNPPVPLNSRAWKVVAHPCKARSVEPIPSIVVAHVPSPADDHRCSAKSTTSSSVIA